LFFSYFSFSGISNRLLNKCKNKEIFIYEEFGIYDLKGNSLFEINQTKDIIQIVPNKMNFNKLIKHQEELNFLISILDYETYLLVSNFKESVLDLKNSLKKYNDYIDNIDYNLNYYLDNELLENNIQKVYKDILNTFNCYIRLISKNEYSQNILKEIQNLK